MIIFFWGGLLPSFGDMVRTSLSLLYQIMSRKFGGMASIWGPCGPTVPERGDKLFEILPPETTSPIGQEYRLVLVFNLSMEGG